jgi:predicted O-methyltransferase YrrM
MQMISEDSSYVLSAIGLLLSRPGEMLDRVRNRLEIATAQQGPQVSPYLPDDGAHVRFHELLRTPLECSIGGEFTLLWQTVIRTLAGDSRDRRVVAGHGHDADVAFSRLVWCATRHLVPLNVVETGVARGITSRFILEALRRNGSGQLWSIDLPPMQNGWRQQSGVAVPAELRDRWTYLRGSSRRLLPTLLNRLGQIDLFIHDSLHTPANMHFELSLAWDALRRGGVLIADDIEGNASFAEFVAVHTDSRPFVARHEHKRGMFGVAVKVEGT